MAINTGVNVSNYSSGGFIVPPVGVDVSNYSAGSFVVPPKGVDVANYSAGMFLVSTNVNPPVWPFVSFPNGYVGVSYSFSWDLVPAAPPTTYTLFSGTLPPGLSIVNTGGSSGDVGTLSGVPTTPGTYTFKLLATNPYGTAVGPSPTTNFSVTIFAVAPSAGGSFVWTG